MCRCSPLDGRGALQDDVDGAVRFDLEGRQVDVVAAERDLHGDDGALPLGSGGQALAAVQRRVPAGGPGPETKPQISGKVHTCMWRTGSSLKNEALRQI